MINLEDLDYNDDTKEIRADFGGFLEDGFYIECEIDYDEDIEKAEPESGIMKDYSTFSNFTFWYFNWYFKIYNSANEEVSFSDRVVKEIKEEIEYELKRQMEEY